MTTGVLPYRTFKDNILNNTGFFECSTTSTYTAQGTSSGNHDGAGMSMGNLQYNFGAANRLTELWQYMINNYEQDCIDSFGTNTTQYNTWKTAIMSTVQQDRINFGANITDPNNSHAVIEPYKSAFITLGNKPNHVAKYKAMADSYYFPNAESIFNQLTCTSRAAYASFFDVYINRGRYYPINMLVVDFERIDADTTLTATQKEAQKIQLINDRANQPENGMDSSAATFKPRRDCMRNQSGSYYGLTYDPTTQFDVNQEPALSNKAETLGINLGAGIVNNVFNGASQIKSVYLGANLMNKKPQPTKSSTTPQTQFRTNSNSYAGIGTATSVTLNAGQKMWIDVQNFVACKTYYTIDGTTPSATNGTLYDSNALSFNSSCTLKAVSISTNGISEAVKTLTVNVAVAPTTTISPSATVQNAIPFTVTLSTSETGATIYYMLGTSTTQYTYSAPFTVSQNSPGVASTQIKVTYWAVGATATETQKTITYDTSGAIPGTPSITVTNSGAGNVVLSWAATANTISYSIYRSTTAPTLGNSATYGTALSSYQAGTTYTDTTAASGTTYYYVVEAGNYQTHSDATVTVTPTAAPTKPTYRYLRILGYGSSAANDVTSRVVEFEVMSGGTNIMATTVTATTILTYDTISTGSTNINTLRDGVKTSTSGSYPIWWTSPLPNAHVVVDFGSQKTIDSMNYYSYSTSTDQRANRFMIQGSNTNNGTDWATVWDMSANTTVQPALPSGYSKTF